jgi:hypothetical protein
MVDPIYPGRMVALTNPSWTVDRDPSTGQSPEQITAYYRNAKPGDVAVIRETQYGMLRFIVTTIKDVNPRRGRVYLAQEASWGGCAFYAKSGKNCWSPDRAIEPSRADHHPSEGRHDVRP